jgi:hypothetical protein
VEADLYLTLVLVGLTLTIGGQALTRAEPENFTRGKAVGLALFVAGVLLLFGAAWWWALIGLVVPSLLIDIVLGIISAIRRPR